MIRTRLSATGHAITLVPVAAILVASIRLNFLDTRVELRRDGPRTIPVTVSFSKGDEMGWFQHGSTIILFAPAEFVMSDNVREGTPIRMGQPLMRVPSAASAEPT